MALSWGQQVLKMPGLLTGTSLHTLDHWCTPLMPGKSVDTFIFALYDEDLKQGPASERPFGLFKTDLTMAYDVGLDMSSFSYTVNKLLICYYSWIRHMHSNMLIFKKQLRSNDF